VVCVSAIQCSFSSAELGLFRKSPLVIAYGEDIRLTLAGTKSSPRSLGRSILCTARRSVIGG
jgi:hypothetical protein